MSFNLSYVGPACYTYFMRKSIFFQAEFVVLTMQSPEAHSEKTPVPPSVDVVQVSHPRKSPSDTISQLSQVSAGANPSFSSPLRATDIGVPRTPEVRVIRQTDEAANDDGYDSEGLRAPWEGCQELDFDGAEAMEESLPVGPPPSLPPLPSPENFAQNTNRRENYYKSYLSRYLMIRSHGICSTC